MIPFDVKHTIQFQWKWQIIIFHLLWIIQFIVYGLACIFGECVCVWIICVLFIFVGHNVDCDCDSNAVHLILWIFFLHALISLTFSFRSLGVHFICQPVFYFRSFRIFLSQSYFSTLLFLSVSLFVFRSVFFHFNFMVQSLVIAATISFITCATTAYRTYLAIVNAVNVLACFSQHCRHHSPIIK